MFWTVVIGVILLFFLLELLRPKSSNRFKPGRFYYTKKWIFRILLVINSHKKTKISDGNTSERKNRGYGRTITDISSLDFCQPLESHPDAIDTVYFNGFDENGTSLALRLARKQNREGELWLMLDIPGVGFFQHPIMPDAGISNMPNCGFTGLGVKCQVIEPLRSWKVTYNGLLRKGLCNDVHHKPGQYVTVKMTFKWECFNDPFNFDIDLDKNLLADAIAREKWTKDFWAKLRGKHQTHYEQCGELTGQIEIDGHDVRNVNLKSFRDHTFGVRNWELFYRYAIHFIWIEEIGVMAMVAVLWMPDYISLLKTGYLAFACGETYPVTDIDLDIEDITKDKIPPEKYSFTFKAAYEEYKVDLVSIVTPEVYHYRNRTSRILERFCTYTVNGRKARGLTEYHYRNYEGPSMITKVPVQIPLLTEPDVNKDKQGQLTLTFQDEYCKSSLLTGGKGSQLAFLTSIHKQIDAHIPRGFCLTLAAFEQQLQENSELGTSIKKILSAIRNEELQSLPGLCSDAVELLASCKINQPIKFQLTNTFKSVFGESCNHVRLAVRSSAAGEDGGEASSAGQMETYLGVKGLDSLLEAVRKCWASAYTYQAVEYRRQQGQPVQTSMAVVIQEMVASDVSGVLFTNDPVTGNPNKMVLDASFGLGEAVVSGKANPDTIIIQRMFDNRLKILTKRLGEKNVEIRMSDKGGVKSVETDMGSTSLCCLEDEQIIQLCQLAIKVETYFGSPRDIEWAIYEDEIYLLQARPITTTGQDTDFDLIHEFDTPQPTGQERLTLGNIGEMMPGIVTPLTGSLFGRAVDRATSVVGIDFGGGTVIKNALKSISVSCGRLFINLTWIGQVYGNSLLHKKSALEMNLLGQVLDDHKESMIKTYGREVKNFFARCYIVYNFFSVSNKKIKIADSWPEKLKTYTVGADCDTADNLYQAIDRQLPDYYEIWETTIHKSARSGTYGGIIMGIISGGKDEWTTENYSDVALLLSQCNNVYSAEVPKAMKEIARMMIKLGKEKEFLEKSDDESVLYLSSNECPTEIQCLYKDFMARHGHRCIREAEFTEKSWRVEPQKLTKVIKSILKSHAYEETKTDLPTLEEAISQLKSPVSAFGKFLLRKWLVKKARDAVGQREFGKSVAVEVSDRFKQAYQRLADLLFLEGKLPERELLYYLTHYEIGHLVKAHSTLLVTKAVRRRKIAPIQADLEFSFVSIGKPLPILKKQAEENRRTTFTLTGMPVSVGEVKGQARVVKSLDDAAQIMKGDILIVCYTDVGWSPYFPLISGLVTEMGGLVSHGAVVAREYGLPCVVNVSDATTRFRSGDFIHLDGTNGCVHRLEDTITTEDKTNTEGTT
ncbi:putative phosphoenolpyruvate synthase isoform X3 [Ruditapes philippinarum]|uniref:putative phosphoenolpyruvate synthase isoform X3 n=1 Tax=Ruditapes philippinarum TaxID=129788 RepID=UPI00295B6823|nr:putative phosphoenolpyruvate synthase isoform X3 [Ruditapes philippinarum]